MRILTISLNAWNDTMATGNTFSNFFQDLEPDDCVANIYCRNEPIDNNICKNYYKITELDIIKNLFSKEKCGHIRNVPKSVIPNEIKVFKRNSSWGKNCWSMLQKYRPTILLFLRECLWNTNIWKNKKIEKFLIEFKPDVIYMHGHNNLYMHKILWYCQSFTNAKVAVFFGDDMYNIKSRGILNTIYHKTLQKQLRFTINNANLLFGGSPLLCEEYSNLFNRKFILLIKTCKDLNYPRSHKYSYPLSIVYAGNLLYGRYQVLEDVSNVIKELNRNDLKFVLKIYSASVVSNKTEKILNDGANSFLYGPRNFDEICNILENCDICLFTESFNDVYKKITRLSFSTKIIDYMQSSSALLSYGPSDVSSIHYIMNSKLGFAAENKNRLKDILSSIAENPMILQESVYKKYNYASINHNKPILVEQLRHL